MKKAGLLLIVFITAMSLFFACQRQLGPDLPVNPVEETTNAGIQGRITAEDGVPLENVLITSGNKTTLTDINGIFRIENVILSARFGFVKAEKEGYFEGSRSIIVNPDAMNFVEIALLEKTQKGDFAADNGGIIQVENGQTVSFEPNSLVTDVTKALYTGTVKVYARWLDPTAPDLNQIMPGDLRGTRTTGEETAMRPYGMLVVELEDAGGEKLQLAAGKKATIAMAIPASLQPAAPAIIPLWYFDTSSGKWIEEGTATKQGDSYIGTVEHFTVWNCDIPLDFVDLTVKLEDQNGNPLTYTAIKVTNTNDNSYGTAYTDSLGYIHSWMPRNASLLLEVYDRCSEVLLSKNFTSTSQDLDLGTLNVTLPSTVSVNITGTAADCNGVPVTEGFVNISLEGLNYSAPVKDGSFSRLIGRCSNNPATAFITVADVASNEQSTARQLEVVSGLYNTGEISACGIELTEYFNVNLDNVDYFPDSLYIDVGTAKTTVSVLSRFGATQNVSLSFEIPGTDPDTYTGSLNQLRIDNKAYRAQGDFNTTITVMGLPGEFVAGSFSGNVIKDSTTVAVPITGSFRIKRIY